VVAAGGDGTLNEVLNGLADADGFGRTRLGVLPLGTVNVFAKELELPQDFEGAWAAIRQGRDRLIDAPWASFVAEGRPQRRFFAQLAGAGLDSRAVELVNWELKKRLGYISYLVAGFQALKENLPPIEVSNGQETASGQLVLVGNGRFYGGRHTMFPQAELSDGILDAVIYPRVNLVTAARGGWGMFTDDFHGGGGTIQLRGAKLELKLNVPDVVIKTLGSITLTASAGGARLTPQKFTEAGNYVYTVDVPAEFLRSDSVTIEFSTDKAIPPGQIEKRELAVIVTSVGLVAKP